jgi:CRP-like cAMP-binding protein
MAQINMFQHSRDTVTLQPGDVLFREGDAGDAMFAIVDGQVELRHRDNVVEELGPGSIVGEMALIDDAPRSASATAVSETRVARVDKEHFTYLVQEHPTFALQVMHVMAERLRRANG